MASCSPHPPDVWATLLKFRFLHSSPSLCQHSKSFGSLLLVGVEGSRFCLGACHAHDLPGCFLSQVVPRKEKDDLCIILDQGAVGPLSPTVWMLGLFHASRENAYFLVPKSHWPLGLSSSANCSLSAFHILWKQKTLWIVLVSWSMSAILNHVAFGSKREKKLYWIHLSRGRFRDWANRERQMEFREKDGKF